MDTAQLKKFAIEARRILMDGVKQRVIQLGFDLTGKLVVDRPESFDMGAVFKGDVIEDESWYDKWLSLESAINRRGIKSVVEEGAYTWFNRMMAIRILQKNNLAQPCLKYDNPLVRVPIIVEDARRGSLPVFTSDQQKLWDNISQDDTKTIEQFHLLLIAFCHQTPMIYKCFGRIDDYTELLLPTDLLRPDGFVDLLNNTTYITDEDFQQTELIGWLYQFYISERKDEVFEGFSKNKKAGADEIPAATQIFTPNWIVKYMVQNTIGRIYLDKYPNSPLREKMAYLVESSDDSYTPTDWGELETLRFGDLACGSGHILTEMFSLLFDMYIEQYYMPIEAVESILANNIIGIDIDLRAKQLATFALLLKACQLSDGAMADCHTMPRVLSMAELTMDKEKFMSWAREVVSFPAKGIMSAKKKNETDEQYQKRFELLVEKLAKPLDCMTKADIIGSAMNFDALHEDVRPAVDEAFNDVELEDDKEFLPYIEAYRLLTMQYDALVMNPPYMGSGNMCPELANYVKANYPRSKADLMAVFMDVAESRIKEMGRYGMINMHSWMFLSSFEELRKHLLCNCLIENMLHLGTRTFVELSGEVVQNTSFVIRKIASQTSGTYFRLVDGDCDAKHEAYKHHENCHNGVHQDQYFMIPGCPIAYWVSTNMIKIFTQNKPMSQYSIARSGFSTGDNEYYIRLWHEVSLNQIAFGLSKNEEFVNSKCVFVPFVAGGGFRRWYGNLNSVVDWKSRDSMHRPRTTYMNLYYKSGITWNAITGRISCRHYDKGFLFEHAAASLFEMPDYDSNMFLAFINSSVFFEMLKLINPTFNNGAEVVSSIPMKISQGNISSITDNNISISRQDWDAHETSWDFQRNELLRMKSNCAGNVADLDMLDEDDRKEILNITSVPTNPNLIEHLLLAYKGEWTRHFNRLHANEEELNRQFIEIYGLQDELTPDVPLNEVTILQQGEISIENNQIVWHDDVIIKQFLSYAIGCFMGRYHLNKPGLHIAHPEPSSDELASYEVNGESFVIDDDGIIPILPKDAPFPDNAESRISDFIGMVLGSENKSENLNFIEHALGKSIEQYMLKDFWKDHKSMYQNRPIYWLFSSKKGAFQCLVYQHRLTPHTAEQIRQKYLLPYIEHLTNQQTALEAHFSSLTAAQRTQLKKVTVAKAECQEYHDRLHTIAGQQIGIDLDDGFVVNYAKYGDVVMKVK